MKLAHFAVFVIRNVLRNRRRTILTVLSIGTAFFLISATQSVLDKLESPSPMPNSGRRAVVRHATSLGLTLPISYRDRIRSLRGVDAVSGAQWFGGVYRNPSNFFAQYAVDADEFFKVYPETYTESLEQRDAFIYNRTASLAGTLLRDRFGWKVGDRVTLKSSTLPFDVETTIAGFVAGGGNESNFYFHWDYLNELFPANATQTIFLIAANEADLPAIVEAVDTMFANNPVPTRTEPESVFIVQLMSMWGDVRLLVIGISTAVLFTLILITANTMAMSIRERTSEIAILRTLGFTPVIIVGGLIAESFVICVTGGLLGSLGSRSLFQMLNLSALTGGVMQDLDVRWQTVLWSASMSVCLALVSTLLPAVYAVHGQRRFLSLPH